ncbi:MAG: sigma-70 family RNA polymerase sigma factor [Planctomycetes bacterium]|jgi:RNA polymerase sigma-70 factor (ECF subfamily)|nr:sigma-70 family RNA polymerase sigma factor [Planctomycetota bacterium]
MLEERYLIWRFKQGSAEAFERIYERHKDALLTLAVVLLGETCAAEDIVHDVFVHVARTRASLRVAGNLKALLAAAVVNRARNYRRDAYRYRHGLAQYADGGAASPGEPEPWAIVNEQLQLLSAAMAKLPYEQREAVALHLGARMSFPEIARIQNAPVNTVQGRCRYGLQKLRSLLNAEATE